MPITVTLMAMPGASAIQGARSMNGRASLIISPQSELGGCAPMPRKLKAAPSRMANVTRKPASTIDRRPGIGQDLAEQDVARCLRRARAPPE